jgi:hypothetical protein
VVRAEALTGEADAKRVGPLLMRLAEWAQETPLSDWAPLDAKAAVQALMKVGLKREARRLAWELMNATPPPDKAPPAKAGPVKAAKPAAVKAAASGGGGVRIQNMPASQRREAPQLLPPPEGAR